MKRKIRLAVDPFGRSNRVQTAHQEAASVATNQPTSWCRKRDHARAAPIARGTMLQSSSPSGNAEGFVAKADRGDVQVWEQRYQDQDQAHARLLFSGPRWCTSSGANARRP